MYHSFVYIKFRETFSVTSRALVSHPVSSGHCHGKIGPGKTGPPGPILDAKTGPAGPN